MPADAGREKMEENMFHSFISMVLMSRLDSLEYHFIEVIIYQIRRLLKQR